MQPKSIYQRWLNHELGDEAALESLCRTLTGLLDSLEPLSEMEKQARAQISEVVMHLGGKARVEGFGELQITSPVLLTNYNREKLDALVAELIEEGQTDLAERIKACRSEHARIGSLRINRLMLPH